ncbi:uncharacterized protein LOC124419773 isoform X2 [Lucilia cuprina]|uniref:uncharacterized protein LOC124419773 isoform X2 n=1 Tax=Lucilia cuprina TaxID=7375 RepID=UPI001F06BA78|nr:uncharacterized protein LOC124419773 isoform X2 [Lucilia cuprina]
MLSACKNSTNNIFCPRCIKVLHAIISFSCSILIPSITTQHFTSLPHKQRRNLHRHLGRIQQSWNKRLLFSVAVASTSLRVFFQFFLVRLLKFVVRCICNSVQEMCASYS